MMSDVDSASECTVHGALPLVLCLLRVLGDAPVRLTRASGGGWRAQFAPRLLPYSYFHFLVFSSYSLLSLFLRFQLNISLLLNCYSFKDITWTLIIIHLGGTVVVSAVGVKSRTEAILTSLKILEPIHVHYRSAKLLRKLYVKESILFTTFAINFFVRIVRWILLCYNGVADQSDMWRLLLPSYIYLYTLSTLQLLLFVLPALRITAALSAINHSLRELLYLIDIQTYGLQDADTAFEHSLIVDTMSIEKIYNKKDRHLKGNICGSIRHVSRCYELMQQAIIRLNDSFGLILIFNYSFLLMFLTVGLDGMLRLLFAKDLGLLFILALLYQIGMFFLSILVGVQPGHEIEREVQHMRCTVSELLSRAASRAVWGKRSERGVRSERSVQGEQGDGDETLAYLLGVLSKQLAVPDLCFAPLKIFKLSRPLVLAIIATSVTFTLLILEIVGLND